MENRLAQTQMKTLEAVWDRKNPLIDSLKVPIIQNGKITQLTPHGYATVERISDSLNGMIMDWRDWKELKKVQKEYGVRGFKFMDNLYIQMSPANMLNGSGELEVSGDVILHFDKDERNKDVEDFRLKTPGYIRMVEERNRYMEINFKNCELSASLLDATNIMPYFKSGVNWFKDLVIKYSFCNGQTMEEWIKSTPKKDPTPTILLGSCVDFKDLWIREKKLRITKEHGGDYYSYELPARKIPTTKSFFRIS